MRRFSYVLNNHDVTESRSVSHLMREAARFSSRITLSDGIADAVLKEPDELIGMQMKPGSKVTVFVEGKDEEAAVAAMQSYFVANM